MGLFHMKYEMIFGSHDYIYETQAMVKGVYSNLSVILNLKTQRLKWCISFQDSVQTKTFQSKPSHNDTGSSVQAVIA